MSRNLSIQLAAVMARMTMQERLLWFAIEAENLSQLAPLDPKVEFVFAEIEGGNYAEAVKKARGDWEPRDPAGWEGGFAENH